MKTILLSFIAVFIGVFTAQAQVYSGSKTLNTTNNITLEVNINSNDNTVELIITGPSSVWHAIGFNDSNMNGAYTIVISGTGVIQERKLGNHTSGSTLSTSILNSNSSVNGNIRTTTITRSISGENNNYYTFLTSEKLLPIIWAKGNGTNLSTHSNNSNSRGISNINITENTSIGITENDYAPNYNIYPNPAITSVNIESKEYIQSLSIVNVFGQKVYTETRNNQSKFSINVSNLENGLYFIQIKDGSNLTQKSFIKE